MTTSRITLVSATLIACFILSACELWGPPDNPVDAAGVNYQGFETVEDPSQVVPTTLNPDATCFPPMLVTNQLIGGEAYEFQIATANDFTNPIYDVEEMTNSKALTDWTTWSVSTTYYWRSRSKVNGAWSDWPAKFATFTIEPLDLGTFAPVNAGNISDITPLIDWVDFEGASEYELQYANSSAGVASAATVVVASSQHEVAFGLDLGTWYWRARAKNADQMWGAWSNICSFSLVGLTVGGPGPAGGTIFYDKGSYSDGWRYLEAWTTDESGSYHWKTSNTITGGTSIALGTGYSNTYTAMSGTDHPAAEQARNATYGGYTDWFLPSKDEMVQMYMQRNAIGGFVSDYGYWSSSEDDYSGLVYVKHFSDGSEGYSNKFIVTPRPVRVVRSF